MAKKVDQVEAYILKKKRVSTAELIEVFDLSESTVRRYLNQLEANKSIIKEYGAIIANVADNLLSIRTRINYLADYKIAISQKAATLIKDGDTLFFDSGTTHMHMAELLHDKKKLTIVTNNLLFAVKIADLNYDVDLIIIPGHIRNSTISSSGEGSLHFLDQFYFDHSFITSSGVSLKNGFSNRTLPECTVKREVIRKSSSVSILADHSKIGKTFPFSFSSFQQVDYLFTDQQVDAQYREVMKQAGVSVQVASLDSSTGSTFDV